MSHAASRADPIDLVRFLAIFLMFFAHYPVMGLVEAGRHLQPDGALFQFLHYGASRASSPFLGIASGYFVYLQIARHGYATTLRKRVRSLYWPAVYWSVIFIVLSAPVAYVVTGEVPGYLQADAWRLVNLVLPVQYAPANFPLHYLVDLFKLCLVAPLIILVLDRLPWQARVALVVLLALVPNSVAQSGNQDNILPRWDLVVFFVAGMALAAQRLDLKDLMTRRIGGVGFAALILYIFLVAPHWRPLLVSDTFVPQYAGYLMVMSIKVAGVLFVVGLAQRLARSAFVAAHAPARRVIFTAFCLHWIVIFFLIRFGNILAGRLNSETGVQLALFLVMPVITFVIAAILWALRTRMRAPAPEPRSGAM